MNTNFYKYDRYFITGGLGAIIGGVSGLIGNAQQSSNIDKQLNAQKQENADNRKYNYMLAQKQNEWNLQQWMRENEYNLPANQMKRYKDAGLNPDLMYQQSNLSAQSPQMTSGAPSSPVDMSAIGQKPTLDKAVSQALTSMESIQRVSLSKAQEKETGARTQEIQGNLKWQDLFNDCEYKSRNVNLDIQIQQRDELNPEQKKVLSATFNELTERSKTYEQVMAESRARVGLLDAQTAHEEVKQRVSEEMVKEVASKTRLNDAQARQALQMTNNLILQGGLIAFDLEHQDARYYTEKEMAFLNMENLKKTNLILYNKNQNLIYEGEILSLDAAKKATIRDNPFLMAVDMGFDYAGKINFNYTSNKSNDFSTRRYNTTKYTTINQ